MLQRGDGRVLFELYGAGRVCRGDDLRRERNDVRGELRGSCVLRRGNGVLRGDGDECLPGGDCGSGGEHGVRAEPVCCAIE